MASLIEIATRYISHELTGAAASHLGENENAVSKGLGGLVPVILAGLAGKAKDDGAFGSIFGKLTDPVATGSLDRLKDLIGGGNLAHNDPRDLAGGLIGQLFGDKMPAILAALAAFAGLKQGSASSLLGIAGPLVMGALGRTARDENLSQGALQQRLISERDDIARAVPGPLASILGIVAPAAAHATHQTAAHTAPAAAAESGGKGWLWGIPVLLALGLLAWTCTRDKAPETVATAPVEPAVVAEAAPTEPAVVAEPAPLETAVVDAIPADSYARELNGVTLTGAFNGVEQRLVEFIDSGKEPCTDAPCWFTFDRLTFRTGSAEIDMEKSQAQLDNIKRILDAYPTIQLKLGGYTDNTGSEQANMTLSQARADAVAAALVAMGVAPERVVSEGYGPQFPVASNDTEEGRAQNRRIDVRVRQR
jgi:outer membrane protein OmpA-like peptidoglycan-associated protein